MVVSPGIPVVVLPRALDGTLLGGATQIHEAAERRRAFSVAGGWEQNRWYKHRFAWDVLIPLRKTNLVPITTSLEITQTSTQARSVMSLNAPVF